MKLVHSSPGYCVDQDSANRACWYVQRTAVASAIAAQLLAAAEMN